MIYFIITEDKKYVKIGFTKDLKKRLVALQNANPTELSVLKTINGGFHEEQIIHRKLSKHHHRLEWFHYNKETGEFINNIKDVNEEPEFQLYEPSKSDNIEELYSKRLSNIEIAKKLEVTIHKVRRVIRDRKLKSKYSNVPKPKYYQHGGVNNFSRT